MIIKRFVQNSQNGVFLNPPKRAQKRGKQAKTGFVIFDEIFGGFPGKIRQIITKRPEAISISEFRGLGGFQNLLAPVNGIQHLDKHQGFAGF